MSKQIAVIDIGTTGIRILAAKINETGIPHIIAKSQVGCKAVRRYDIESEEELTNSIKAALNKVKERTGIIIKTAYINISGDHLKFVNNSDSVTISHDEEINIKHIGLVLDKAASVELYDGETLVDVIPMRYTIDGQEIKEPVGLRGDRLSVDAKVILGSKDFTERITNCINNAGVAIDGLIPIAVSVGELIPFEEEEGSTLLIDVGGQFSEFVLYYKGKPFTLGFLPVGGDSVTNDLSKVFKISISEAETLKKDYPLATLEVLSNNIDVAIFSLETGLQEIIKVAQIVEVMQARVENIFYLLKEKLENNNIDSSLIDKVILTGDGLSKFKGIDKVCSDILETSLDPIDFSRLTGMDTKYTTASGMVMYMASQIPLGRKQSNIERIFIREEPVQSKKKSNKFSKIAEKIQEFFASFKE